METLAAMNQPRHLDEAQLATAYADVLTQVAADQRPVIVQRGGIDVAAVVPLGFLDVIRESLARQEAERLAWEMDWSPRSGGSESLEQWFDGEEPKPF